MHAEPTTAPDRPTDDHQGAPQGAPPEGAAEVTTDSVTSPNPAATWGNAPPTPTKTRLPASERPKWVTEPTNRSAVALALLDTDGVYRFVNPAWEQLMGVSAKERVGTTVFEHLHPDTVEQAREGWRLAWNEGNGATNRVQVKRGDGQMRWMEVGNFVVQPERDGTEWMLSTAVDVSESEVLGEAFRQSPSLVVVTSPYGQILRMNDVARLHIEDPERGGGRDAFEINQDILDVIDQVMAGEVVRGLEAETVMANGEPICLRVSASPIEDDSGSVASILIIAEDVTRERAAVRKVQASEGRIRKLIANVSDFVGIVGADGTMTLIEGAGSVKWSTLDGVQGESLLDSTHPDDWQAAFEMWFGAMERAGATSGSVLRLVAADGDMRYVDVQVVNHFDDPDINGMILTGRDVTDVTATAKLLENQAAILELISRPAPIEAVADAIAEMMTTHGSSDIDVVVFRTDGGPADDPRSWLRVVGSPSLPINLLTRLDGNEGGRGSPLQRAATTGEAATMIDEPVAFGQLIGRYGFRSAWADPVIERATGLPIGVVLTMSRSPRLPTDSEQRVAAVAVELVAIAIERDALTAHIAHRDLHDELTGLPNRSLLVDRLQVALQRAERSGHAVTLLSLDLDHFKFVNDSLGHTAGDDLLAHCASRLRSILRPHDTIARLGGDEFVILFEHEDDESSVKVVVDRLQRTLKEPFQLADRQVYISTSIGLCRTTANGSSAEEVLANADSAMYRAKSLGRDRLVEFDEEMRAETVDRLSLESDLRNALSRDDELVLFYQPKIDVASGQVIGVEALVRWAHPTEGMLAPDRFIPLAEQTGLIVALGSWVLDRAFAQLADWQARGLVSEQFAMAVNLAPRQLWMLELPDEVEELLDLHGIAGSSIVLELTEGALISDSAPVHATMDALKDLGLRLAIDDFGTGYSSLSYLDRFPVDIVKIDKSFVSKIDAGGEGSAIASAVVHMAEALGLMTVGEGVETPEQLAGLRELGCDWAQGYFMSRPVPPAELEKLLATDPAW